MSQKDVGNKVPIYKLKKTDEVMKYYDEWGEGNKYDKDMVDWNYTGPKETTEVYTKYEKNKNSKIYDAGCGTGLVGVELKKYGFSNFYGADLTNANLNNANLTGADLTNATGLLSLSQDQKNSAVINETFEIVQYQTWFYWCKCCIYMNRIRIPRKVYSMNTLFWKVSFKPINTF